MRARWRWLATLLVALATAPLAEAAPDTPDWSLATLPGGRAGLLPRLGLSPDLPTALALGEVIRIVHASRETPNPPLAAVRSYFASPPIGAAESIPVPLPVAVWRDILGRNATETTLLPLLIENRRASLLCFGLLQVDRETARFLMEDRGLLRRIYERHAGAFAAFAQVVRVQDGRLVLPGGEEGVLAWQAMLEKPMTEPSRAIVELLDADDSRLAYFADAVDGLDASGLAMVFNPSAAEEKDRLERTRSIYRSFRNIEPAWRFGDFPFVRLGADPSLLLRSLRTRENGQLRHTKDFWEAVFSERALPSDPAKRWAQLGAGDRAEPGWLLDRLTDAPLPVRIERMYLHEFVERLTDRVPDASAADLAWLAHAYRRYPALVLSLERLNVADLGVLKRFVRHASQLVTVAEDSSALEMTYVLFQAPLALLTQARTAHAISDETTRTLVASLASIEPTRSGYGRAVARWLETTLLPALGYQPVEGASAEVTLLEALAGLRAATDASPPRALTWEGHTYRVDAAAPELVRLTEVRGLQGGNTLDAALALCRVGHTLSTSETLESARKATATLNDLRPSLVPLETSERTTASSPPDVPSLAEQGARDLARVRSRGELKRLSSISTRLGRAEDATLADVLTSILYAVWLGDPQGPAFLAGNVARRHDFGVQSLSASDRESTPWQLPVETSGEGEPWHLRGALLGLDMGLARLALRRTRLDLPDDQPRLNEGDRRTLMTTLALTAAGDFEDGAAARVADWLRNGRAIAATPTRLVTHLDTLGLDGRRRQAILWASAHTPEALPSLLLRTELVVIGRDPQAEVPAVWGMSELSRTGFLRLTFPTPPSVQRYAGRAGAGLLLSRIADLKLRVLEVLDELHLPASLGRGVLAAALQDYLDEVRPAHGDDWWTLAHHVDRLPRERFDDYIAALTAGGPLVPLEMTTPAANGHE